MPNLAQIQVQKKYQSREIAQVISFPKPSSIQEAIVNTKKSEDGYTPLPNFICDEGYLVVLDGEAIKCLVFLNRHINGFHLKNKGMSETLIKKVTGIKDGRTIQKYMAQLAKYQLIRIEKEKGKSNVYFLTFDSRLPTQHVGTFNVPTQNVPTSHVGGVPTQHAGGSTYMACGSVKENIKYKFKNIKKDDSPVDNFKAEMFGDSVEYHVDNKNLYSLRELASVYPIQSDLTDQAKQIDPDSEDSKIMSELKNFAQWSTSQQKTTAQGWMNYWIYRIQNLKTPKAKPQSQKPSKQKSKVLSDKQIDFFASKLCNNSEFASMFSNMGESQKEFEVRISACLRDVNNVKKWASYLHSVGFVGQLEDFA